MFTEKSTELLYSIQNEQCLLKKKRPLKQLHDLLSSTNEMLDTEHNENNQKKEFIIHFITLLCKSGMVKDFKQEEELEYERKDFTGVPEVAEHSLKCIELFISKLHSKDPYIEIIREVLVPIILLCASHSEGFLWSSEEAVKSSDNVIDAILTFSKCPDLESLLHGSEEGETVSHKGIIKDLFKTLRPWLTNNTWKKNPSVKYIFKWVLVHSRHPYLSNHLLDFLPPSLFIIDHHLDHNKVLGIECLHHIINHVPFTELKMYGRADVVYDALHRLTYGSSPPVINVLYPCLLSFISHMERDSSHVYSMHHRNKYDEVYEQLLWSMEMEQRLILRKIYSDHMNHFIQKMGIRVVRHMKKTVRIIIDYILTYDGPEETTQKNAFLALITLLKVSWPRIPFHCEDILKGLLRCIYDYETAQDNMPPQVRKELLSLSKESLLLLKRTCPEKFEYLTSNLVKEDLPGLSTLRDVISNPE